MNLYALSLRPRKAEFDLPRTWLAVAEMLPDAVSTIPAGYKVVEADLRDEAAPGPVRAIGWSRNLYH